MQKQQSEMFYVKVVLNNLAKFTGKQLCQSQPSNFIKKETLAQVFCCEVCKIFKINFFLSSFGGFF